MRVVIAAAATSLLAGCASVNPRPAFEDVQKTVADQSKVQPEWSRTASETSAAEQAVATLLAAPLSVDAAVQIASGSSATAIADYERALAGPEPAGAIYSEAAALYLQTGNRDKARTTIEKGYARLKEPPSLTVPLIRTYRELGLQANADKVALQCATRWPKMQGLCMAEAKGQ